jgi:Kef-type K+ transport system membrane component KefB
VRLSIRRILQLRSGIVLIGIGLSAGLITRQLYTVLVLMTLVTTWAAVPLQRLLLRRIGSEDLADEQRSAAESG